MGEQQTSKGWQEALSKIREAGRTGATGLDLSSLGLTLVPGSFAQLSDLRLLDLRNNQLTSLPDSLTQLSKLQSLDLTNNRLSSLPDSLAQLSNLQQLNLSYNQLTSVPVPLAQLSNLQSLSLSNNELTSVPDSLAQLCNLQQLNLSYNRLTSLPDSSAQLSSLFRLDLSGNQMTAIPELLGQIPNLRFLDLSRNRITAIPDSIAQLSSLQTLYLYGNQIAAIPDSIAQLSNLQALSFSSNQVTSIPGSIALLSKLRMLYLYGNQITTIPDSVSRLANLQALSVHDNLIAAVPESLGGLANLEQLNLANNRLTVISESLMGLPKLTALFLHGNPGLGVPDEILGPRSEEIYGQKRPKAPREILEYLRSLGDARPLNEAKLIMVGHGAVGKSSLVEKLVTGKFRPGKKATEGIKISDWTCQLSRTDKAAVHIWDFGGQEMMHATHQFFLTQRSLYLLVLNRRQGGIDREADYWFRLIRAFGGKDAPVVVVLNKQELEPFDVNRGAWLEKYAGNIKGFVETDCADGKSVARLKKKIQDELKNLKSVTEKFPRRWFAIKDELSRMSEQYITFEAYRAMCRKHSESDQDNQTSLAGFLRDLGIALNYTDDPRLRFAYVLKPEWVTEGIYALLHGFVKTKGLLTLNAAQQVLGPKGYSAEATDFILGLMEKFEISFPLGDKQRQILIPELLEDRQPEEAGSFNPTECLNFGYHYAIVPEGLLPRFIVRTHHLSESTLRWKSGVILRDASSGCGALVRADTTQGQIRVYIDGPRTTRRELLAVVRYNFDVIHSDYEFKPSALVYPEGAPDSPQRLESLEAMLNSGRAATVPVVLPDNTVITPSIRSLIEPVKSGSAPLRLFLSYSHKDEKYVDELRKDLKLMERNGLIQPWYDRALTAGKKWEPQILQELNEADAVVCQLSRDFLNSDFCVLTELDTAIKRQEAGLALLIAYVLTDCGWKEVPKLSSFQILPKDAKPLVDWKDKNKYWRAVAEGIQAALKKLQKEKADRPTLFLTGSV